MKLMLLTVLLGLFLTSSLSTPLNTSSVHQFDDTVIYKLEETSSFNQSSPIRLWEDRIVYYDISPELYPFRKKLSEAMDVISKETGYCIRFKHSHDKENYVSIKRGNGCNSHVGMIGGVQELILDLSCLQTGILIHELMHTLGYFHEHSRPDRDDYLNIFLENVEESKQFNFVKLEASQYPYDIAKFPFDFESIMIYGENAFSKNKAPTMMPKEWVFGTRIKGPETKKHLSSLNVQLVRSTYGCDEI